MKKALAGILLLLCSLTTDTLTHSQETGGVLSRQQGRREGTIVLPTPPFNPDAGILRSPKGRSRNLTKGTPRRSVNRSVNTSIRRPRQGRRRGHRARRKQA